MSFDVTNLENAIIALRKLYERVQDESYMSQQDDISVNGLRSGVIQHFEFTYELSRKFIQKYLRQNLPGDEPMWTAKDLFRIAFEYGLVRDPEMWFKYLDSRNLTVHTYNEVIAVNVFDKIEPFIRDAEYLLDQLKVR